jgi:PAS domain S-box-containing protein
MKLPAESVYSKALALFVALCFLLGTAIVSLTQFIIAREFRLTEDRQAERDMGALLALCDRELMALDAALSALNPSDATAPTAVQPQALTALRMDVFGEADSAGRLVRIVLSPSAQSPEAAETAERIARAVSTAREKGFKRSGFDAPEGKLALVSWVPGNAGDSHTLFVVRFFDGSFRAFAESVLDGVVTFTSLDGTVLGPPGSEDILSMLSAGTITTTESADGRVTARKVLRGLDGAMLGTLDLTKERDLQRSGEGAVQIFLTVLVLGGGLLFGLTWYLLDRTILIRVRDLTAQVEEKNRTGDLPVKLAFRGSDELGILARRIEDLASLIERLQQQYRAVVEDQTETICRFDDALQVRFCNSAFLKTFGGQQEGRGQPLSAILTEKTYATLARRFQRLYPGHPMDDFRHEVDMGNGKTAWFRSTLRRNFDASGTGTGGQWVASDVTPQVQAEEGMAESERQLRALSVRLLYSQDDERRKIARELHDSTAQSLSALEMNVSLLEPIARDERSRRLVAETRRIAQDCCEQLRNISYLLHPPLLEEVGLPFAIRWFADGFTTRTGIALDLEIGTDFPRLDKGLETALFRVVQEATSNIYRHSGAGKAKVALRFSQKAIELAIEDDGHGFADGKRPGPGVGLAGMRERITSLGGNLSISNSESGVTIRVHVPWDPHEQAKQEENTRS